MTAKEKMTAPIASVGADVEQPLSNKLTNQSIADLPGKGNLQATNNAENTAKSANKKNPDDLFFYRCLCKRHFFRIRKAQEVFTMPFFQHGCCSFFSCPVLS